MREHNITWEIHDLLLNLVVKSSVVRDFELLAFIVFQIILLHDTLEYQKTTSWIFEIVLFDFYGVLYSVGQMETNGSV